MVSYAFPFPSFKAPPSTCTKYKIPPRTLLGHITLPRLSRTPHFSYGELLALLEPSGFGLHLDISAELERVTSWKVVH